MLRLDEDVLLAHRLYGLHSGIPECCVTAWVMAIQKAPGWGNLDLPRVSGVNYRPCWDCYNKYINSGRRVWPFVVLQLCDGAVTSVENRGSNFHRCGFPANLDHWIIVAHGINKTRKG